jgi:hypothetical protein
MASIKKYLLFGSILLITIIFIAYPYRGRIKHRIKGLLGYSTRGFGGGGSGDCPNCHTLFTDNVETHANAYLFDGIKPQNEDADLDNLTKSGELIKLETDSLFIVRKTRFSRPYILPKGFSFIQELSTQYYKKCISDSIKYVPFTISSLTRSIESIDELMDNNSNAIKNSAHLRGKTFDISYRAFNDNQKQTEAFIGVLEELRVQNRCFVKFERNGCLHITVI